MRDDRTANLLYLIAELQERYGPYPLGRPALVTWLCAKLDVTPGQAGVDQVLDDYPGHIAELKAQ